MPRLLDLFCSAGGAAMGYHLAGFDEIVGVDIVPQPNYPFHFVQGDALKPPVRLEDFDLIHASPPCQRFSTATLHPEDHPDLIDSTRRLLANTHHVIENVRNSGLVGHIQLCGSMFGMQIQRHRFFELSFFAMSPPCHHVWDNGRPWTITGHLHHAATIYPHSQKPSRRQALVLMETPWMTHTEVVEAIPPAYTQFIGEAFLAQRGGE